MNSNVNYTNNKSPLNQYGSKLVQDEKSKPRSNTRKIQSNKRTADQINKYSKNQLSSANQLIKQTRKKLSVNNSKLNEHKDDLKQNLGKAIGNHHKQSNIYAISQLTPKNYAKELHRALLMECKCNLVDFRITNDTLDVYTMSAVTADTLKAVKNKKIFSILGYFPKISEELKSRGWVEKRDPSRPPINYLNYFKSPPYMINGIESPPVISSKNLKIAIWERMKSIHSWNILKDKRSDFVFVTRKNLVNWSNFHELTSVSQMTSHVFCTKNGLAQILESSKNTVTDLMFPRCHYIRGETDYDAFMEDYIITALTGVLKIIVQSIENRKKIFSELGNLPYEMIMFVRRCVFKFLNKRQTGSSEKDMWTFESEKEIWEEFMKHYTTLITDDNAKFRHQYSNELELDTYSKCMYLLDNVKIYCPQHYIDGNTNTWIVKPADNCSGYGITLARELNTIKQKINEIQGGRNHYILQKYIEKPLLVHKCKIDVRQWFLVTNMNPVVVWMYKEGYVRFCANRFSMNNMHESVHLSNVRLQRKYRNIRLPIVPEEFMWNYSDLKNHLTSIGQPDAWDEVIFPGMGKSVYAVMEATTDASRYRARTFQLFGADFVITDTLVPYLIEINSIPGLNPSTSVIANLVPSLLEDIVKVTVDRGRDARADTGLFVKVTPPERWTAGFARPSPYTGPLGRFAPPRPYDAVAVEDLYQRWIDRVNERLDAMRASEDGPFTGRCPRYCGESLVSVLMSMPPLPVGRTLRPVPLEMPPSRRRTVTFVKPCKDDVTCPHAKTAKKNR